MDICVWFGCDVLVVLEIGFGSGMLMLVMVKVEFYVDVIVVDVYCCGLV